MANFEECFEKVLKLEGGYKLHEVAGDRGGMTYAGIARNSWPAWSGWRLIDGGETSSDMLSVKVREFYKTHFWDAIRGDDIGFQGVALMLYDFSVNAGLKTALQLAQKIVGVSQDGVMGPKTFAALNGYVHDTTTERLFIAEYSLAKVFRYRDICLNDSRRCYDRTNSNLKFLCGWINRVQAGIE